MGSVTATRGVLVWLSELTMSCIKWMELLLDSGADIESKDAGGQTALSLTDGWRHSIRAFLWDRDAKVDILEE